MALLLHSDYEKLHERGIAFVEDEGTRRVIFLQMPLPVGLYRSGAVDVLVEIPPNYNEGGNDMFWTLPRLQRADGGTIPNTCDAGGGDNRRHDGSEYCRWSRHWQPDTAGRWRPGVDDIISIYRRVEWALKNPTTNVN